MGDVGKSVKLFVNVLNLRYNGGRDRSTARLTLGVGLAVSAFPLSVPV